MYSQIPLFFLLAAVTGALTVIALHMLDALDGLMRESRALVPLVLDDQVYQPEPERIFNR